MVPAHLPRWQPEALTAILLASNSGMQKSSNIMGVVFLHVFTHQRIMKTNRQQGKFKRCCPCFATRQVKSSIRPYFSWIPWDTRIASGLPCRRVSKGLPWGDLGSASSLARNVGHFLHAVNDECHQWPLKPIALLGFHLGTRTH